MKILKSISQIINYKTLIITCLAVLSTYLCGRYSIQANYPLTIIGVAIVFPVVFSINSAYQRREKALSMLADFQAHAAAVFYASRDWLENKDEPFQFEIKEKLVDVYGGIRQLCTSEEDELEGYEKKLFSKMSALSRTLQKFREKGLPTGEMSRVNQYFSKMKIPIENLKMILHYRTPITLRAYSKVFIYSFPILYGPYFEHAAEEYSAGLKYVMPVVFSFIMVSLDNIQGHLENPFDQVGEDDVKFDVEKFDEMIG